MASQGCNLQEPNLGNQGQISITAHDIQIIIFLAQCILIQDMWNPGSIQIGMYAIGNLSSMHCILLCFLTWFHEAYNILHVVGIEYE